jgi:hypothetical protein
MLARRHRRPSLPLAKRAAGRGRGGGRHTTCVSHLRCDFASLAETAVPDPSPPRASARGWEGRRKRSPPHSRSPDKFSATESLQNWRSNSRHVDPCRQTLAAETHLSRAGQPQQVDASICQARFAEDFPSSFRPRSSSVSRCWRRSRSTQSPTRFCRWHGSRRRWSRHRRALRPRISTTNQTIAVVCSAYRPRSRKMPGRTAGQP